MGKVTAVRDILRAAARAWGLGPAARLAWVREAWPAIVGPNLAQSTAPLAVRRRTLLVGVNSSAAAQEVRLRGEAILRALARELREDVLTRVVPVTRRRLPAPDGPPPARRARPRSR